MCGASINESVSTTIIDKICVVSIFECSTLFLFILFVTMVYGWAHFFKLPIKVVWDINFISIYVLTILLIHTYVLIF